MANTAIAIVFHAAYSPEILEITKDTSDKLCMSKMVYTVILLIKT